MYVNGGNLELLDCVSVAVPIYMLDASTGANDTSTACFGFTLMNMAFFCLNVVLVVLQQLFVLMLPRLVFRFMTGD